MAENLGESKKRSRVMYGQSLAFVRDDLRLTTIMPPAYHSCTGGEKWLWAPLEEALSQPFLWNVPPISPHQLLLPSHQPSQPCKGNTPPINTRACVRVLSPQSLHGSDVAAAQLPATGPSSVSATLYSLPALRCSPWGKKGRRTHSRGRLASFMMRLHYLGSSWTTLQELR